MLSLKKLFEQTECPYVSECCFCNRQKIADKEKEEIRNKFCFGNFTKCARYKLKQSGKEVPENLSPYGKES